MVLRDVRQEEALHHFLKQSIIRVTTIVLELNLAPPPLWHHSTLLRCSAMWLFPPPTSRARGNVLRREKRLLKKVFQKTKNKHPAALSHVTHSPGHVVDPVCHPAADLQSNKHLLVNSEKQSGRHLLPTRKRSGPLWCHKGASMSLPDKRRHPFKHSKQIIKKTQWEAGHCDKLANQKLLSSFTNYPISRNWSKNIMIKFYCGVTVL